MTDDEEECDRIIADCSRALEVSPCDTIALIRRGRAWYEKNDYSKAIADFDNALSESVDVDTPRILNLRGLAFTDSGDHDLAITDFTEAIRRAPGDKGLIALHFNRGRSRYFKEAHRDAIEDFTETIRLDPGYADAYGMRGLAWQGIGDYRRSIDDYGLAILTNPESADAYHNRGNAWVDLGKLRKGIADFAQAIILDPGNAVTHNSRGIALRRKGRYAEALVDYERALEIDPHSAQRLVVLGAFLAACPNRRYRDGERALQLLTKANELTNHANARYVSLLAAAHAELGDFAKAITIEQNAHDLTKDETDKQLMQDCIELYKRGRPWRIKSPSWRQRWA